MEKISINLLPLELRTKTKADIKKNLIIKLSVGVLVFCIIISASALAWSVIQSQLLKKTNDEYQNIIAKVKANEKKEGTVILLKKRLELISQISEKDSSQLLAFSLINNLIPPNVQLLNLKIGKDGQVEMNCFTETSQDMKVLLDSLTDPSQTEGKITNAKVVNFTKSPTGYTFDVALEFNSGDKTPVAQSSPAPAGKTSQTN